MTTILSQLDSLITLAKRGTPGKLVAFQASGDAPHWRINAQRKLMADKYFAWCPEEDARDGEQAKANAESIVALRNFATGGGMEALKECVEALQMARELFAFYGAMLTAAQAEAAKEECTSALARLQTILEVGR